MNKLNKIDQIILHYSETKPIQNIDIEDIRRWHKEKGWIDVGYHFFVKRNGIIQRGRPLNVTGAHTLGQNSGSIGICWEGGVDEDGTIGVDNRTKKQIHSLNILISSILVTLQPDRIKIRGHRDYSGKLCPAFDANKEYGWLVDTYRNPSK